MISAPIQALKHYFGYDQFRPGQAEIIDQALQARDLLVLMPTGGGKSLCYQLPAVMAQGVTLVVSPLIALMEDQVLDLKNNDIPATYLNSTLRPNEQRAREQGLLYGDYKLLYIAPERLLQEDFWPFIDQLNQQQGIPRLVVDEAHCISDWGHDFRPEYRQLRQVRHRLQGLPVTALTATATDRVRADIKQQLDLQHPFEYIASFNRPNLYYAVKPKSKQTDLDIVDMLRSRDSGSAIIYSQSRASVEKLATYLTTQGIPALPYHAGLAAEDRQFHQTQFIRDQVQVMVATVAFGMGINKPDVRLVIHYDLPKTMEHYYQESGRAGRDGLAANCIMFYSAGDRGKVEYLISQKTDPQDQRIARQQLRLMIDYATSHLCRRHLLLAYFSERVIESNCQNCDNCLDPVELEDRTIEAQKFLSCVYRCQQRFGMKHIIDVLRGAKDQRLLDLKHDQLSTYGIGQDLSSKAWQKLGRSLLQQGLVTESLDGFPILSLNDQSMAVLKGDHTVQVPKLDQERLESIKLSPSAETGDDDLFQALRKLRKRLADQQAVPPFMVFSDRTLTEMAQEQPVTLEAFAQLNGVGNKKLAQYGQVFLVAIQAYLTQQSDSIEPLQTPSSQSSSVTDSQPTVQASPQADPTPATSIYAETFALHQQGYDVETIAKKRQLTPNHIYKHLALLLANGMDVNLDALVTPARQRKIFRAIYDLHDPSSLTQIQELVGESYSYDEIRLVRAALFYIP